MAAQSAELSRRIFEDVWNRKNLNAIDDLIVRQLHSPRRQFPRCQRNRRLQTIC